MEGSFLLLLLFITTSTHAFYKDDGPNSVMTWNDVVVSSTILSTTTSTSNYIPPIAIDETTKCLYAGTVDAVLKYCDIDQSWFSFNDSSNVAWGSNNIVMTVLLITGDTVVVACGTYDGAQACNYYHTTNLEMVGTSDIGTVDIVVMTPPTAYEAVVAIATDENLIFTGVYFMNTSPTMARLKFDENNGAATLTKEIGIFTTTDARLLNNVDFIKVMEYNNESVLYFFRESCYELEDYADEDVYSRVGRVCKYDKGSEDEWSTFLKARLVCSIPSSNGPDFHFNYLYGVYEFGDYVYGVFTTPDNSYHLSAVCKYNLADLNNVLDESPFLFRESCTTAINNEVFTEWNELPAEEETSPRSGQCSETYTAEQRAESKEFLSERTLVSNYVTVSDEDGYPTLILEQQRFTQIVVDQRTVGDCTYNILFIGTEDGGLLRVVEGNDTAGDCTISKSFVIGLTEINITSTGEPITSMHLIKDYIFMTSHDTLFRVPTSSCEVLATCADCINDPYCAWNNTDCVNSDLIDIQEGCNSVSPSEAVSPTSVTTAATTPVADVCEDIEVEYSNYLDELQKYWKHKNDCCEDDNSSTQYCSNSKK